MQSINSPSRVEGPKVLPPHGAWVTEATHRHEQRCDAIPTEGPPRPDAVPGDGGEVEGSIANHDTNVLLEAEQSAE